MGIRRTGGRELVDDEKSAANKTRVLRVEYRREDQYLSIEIQPIPEGGENCSSK